MAARDDVRADWKRVCLNHSRLEHAIAKHSVWSTRRTAAETARGTRLSSHLCGYLLPVEGCVHFLRADTGGESSLSEER